MFVDFNIGIFMHLLRRRKIPAEDITHFLGELSILLESGLSLNEALAFTKQGQVPPLLSKFINSIQESVQNGQGLASSLAAYPQYVQPFLVELLSQAEREQHLHTTLTKIVRFREANDIVEINLGERTKIAIAYPFILLILAAMMLSIVMIFVIPQFKLLFDGLRAELPALTILIINISSFIQAWWWMPVPIFILLLIPISKDTYTNKYTNTLDYLRTWLAFNSPGFGNVNHAFEITRCLRTWEFMSARSTSIEKTLDASASVVHSTIYAHTLRQMRIAVTSDIPLAAALNQQALFPYKVSQALLIAMRDKGASKLLEKLADLYTHQALLRLDRNSRLFTLFSTLVVGLIIGIIIIAMYLPIFQMAATS